MNQECSTLKRFYTGIFIFFLIYLFENKQGYSSTLLIVKQCMELVTSDDLITSRHGDGFVAERRFRVGYYIFEVGMSSFNTNRPETVIMMDAFVTAAMYTLPRFTCFIYYFKFADIVLTR